MALVKMITRISGMRDGVEWPDIGETINVPASEADDLVRMNLAQRVEEPKAERAIVDPVVETATVKRGVGRPRKSQD